MSGKSYLPSRFLSLVLIIAGVAAFIVLRLTLFSTNTSTSPSGLKIPGVPGQTGAAASPTPSVPPGFARPAIATPLSVSGHQVVDAHGVPVLLGGVHRIGYEAFSGHEISAAEADAIATFASMVRIQVGGQLVTTDECGPRGAYLARLDRAVTALTIRNVVALIDLHYSSVAIDDSGSQHACKNRVLPLPPRAEATAAWQVLAGRYASNPLVAFELYNEPHPVASGANNWAAWLNGDTEKYGGLPTATYQAAGMKDLYATVAAASTQNLIFVDANGYAGDPSQLSTSALGASPTRTVWAMHLYTCPHLMSANDSLATDCRTNYVTKRQFPTASEDAKQWGAHGQPVVITETGFPNSGPPNNNGVGYDPAGDWLRTTTCWAADLTKHGGAAVGVVAYDEAEYNDPNWALFDYSASWHPFAWGQPLVNYLQTAQPPGGAIVPTANVCS